MKGERLGVWGRVVMGGVLKVTGLAEKLPDLLVHVTQEVDVRRSPAGAFVLH